MRMGASGRLSFVSNLLTGRPRQRGWEDIVTHTRILIVEDEGIVCQDLKNQLKRMGYAVAATAATGEAAIRQAAEMQPDLILMDITLKGEMDGVEAAESIRQRFHIPILYLTAHADPLTLQRAKLTGPLGYVLKPFEERALRTAIEVALHQHSIERQLRWETDSNAALAGLARALISAASLEDIAALVLEQAKNLTGSAFGFVGYIDPQTRRFVSSTLTRDIWDACHVADKRVVFEKFSGLWGWVLRERRSLISNHPAADPRSSGVPQGHIPIEQFLGAPAMLGDMLVGMIALANPGREYNEQDERLVEQMAALYALAIQRERTQQEIRQLNAELERRVVERTAQLTAANEKLQREIAERARAESAEREQRALAEALRDTAATLTGTLDLDQVLDCVLAQVGHVVPHDAANVMLIEGDIAHIVRLRGYPDPAMQQAALANRIPIAQTPPLHTMAKTGRPLAIPVVRDDPAWVEVPTARWVQSYAGAPIHSKGQVIGFLNLNSATSDFFTPDHAERLQAFANQAGVAIENARLYQSLQRANAQLRAALQAKEEMLQNVSHELRTPLTMIYGYINMLSEEGLGPLTPEQAQAVEVMRRQGDRLRFMVDRLITLQTFDARLLRRVKLELRPWLEQSMQAWEVRATGANIHLQLNLPADLPTVWADPIYLDHVLVNLLDNAFKFSPNGGVVQIRAWVHDNEVIMAIADQGVGIAPDRLPRLFELFQQADGSTTRRFGGMGIGLALCRTIVEAHGGRIWAESAGEGQGSTFYVSFETDRLPPES